MFALTPSMRPFGKTRQSGQFALPFPAGALLTEFEHSIECQVGRDFAWKFWTNVDNWAAVDPAVEWAKLEGPFIAGTKGRTKPRGADPNEWEVDGQSTFNPQSAICNPQSSSNSPLSR